MSRRARTIDSDDPHDDDPIEVNWSGVKQGRGKYKRRRQARGGVVPPPPLQTQDQVPPPPMVYLGDPTEAEVIENVRALPEIGYGKVNKSC